MRLYVDRLLAETVPDGTFGGARPRRGNKPQAMPDPNASRHAADLSAELAAYAARRRRDRAAVGTPLQSTPHPAA